MQTNKTTFLSPTSQAAYDSLPSGLIWLDEEGQIVAVNKQLAADLNQSKLAICQLSIKHICPLYTSEVWAEEWQTLKDTKVKVLKTELMTELGFFFPVRIILSFIHQKNRTLVFGIVQNLLDIDQDELIQDMGTDYSRIGRWELDVIREQTVLTSNCYDIVQLNVEDPPLTFGDHESFFEQVLTKEQLYRLQAMLNVSFEEQLPTELELEIIQKEQKTIWIHLKTRPIISDNIVVKIVGTIQDISQFKQKDKQLSTAFEQIENLNNQLKVENIYLKEELEKVTDFEEIITTSPNYRKVLVQIGEVAPTDATVLIIGETGTGKELVASAVHRLSNRHQRPMIKVNCATLPDHLMESELFGHERGAFTGAIARKIGRFEIADKGTIFLDEIGELPMLLQAKLLRVLQEGELDRLGSNRVVKVDVRIIAATNRDLGKLIEEGRFREDLYFRLNVFPIDNIPLRERKEDIPLLVSHFAKKYSDKIGKNIESVSQLTLDRLMKYPFPGNIRELQNIIERGVIQSKGSVLKLTAGLLGKATYRSPSQDVLKTFEEMQREYILKVLKYTRWKVSGYNSASEILNINSNTLESKMRKLGIRRQDFMM